MKIGLIVTFFITDKDKSGFVDKAELKAYLKTFEGDREITDEDFKELFDSVVKDGEVKLSLNEFISFLLDWQILKIKIR